jgi:uncharacterized protein with FMN-binding domain
MKRALLIAGGTVGGLGAVLSITPPQLNSSGGMAGLSTIASAAATTAAPVAHTTTTAPAATTAPASTTPVATTANTSATSAVKKKKVIKKKVAVAKATRKTTPASITTKATTTKATTTKATTTKATTTKATTTKATTTKATTTKTNTPAATTPAATTSVATTPATKRVSGTFTGSVVNVNYGNVQVQITVVDGKITEAQALQAPSGRSDRFTQYALPILRSQTLAAQGSNIQGASGASYTSYGWYTSLQAALAKAGL